MFQIDQSPRYTCIKCKLQTSGIILKGKSKKTRWCMTCNSPLLHCNHCSAFTSGTVQDDGSVKCDSCCKEVSDGSLLELQTQ